MLAVFACGSLLFLVTLDLAMNTYEAGNVSRRVQHDGFASPGSVETVQNTRHGGVSVRGTGTWWTSSITVSLSKPLDGTTTTVASYPNYSLLRHGDKVNVLIDPQHPIYAELPGQPSVGSRNWLLAGALAAVCGVIDIALALVLLRGLRWTGRADGNPQSETTGTPS
jgi:hypothetical protein